MTLDQILTLPNVQAFETGGGIFARIPNETAGPVWSYQLLIFDQWIGDWRTLTDDEAVWALSERRPIAIKDLSRLVYGP